MAWPFRSCRRWRHRGQRRGQDERLRHEPHLPLAVLDARVDEDADERSEEAVARAQPSLPAGRLHQPPSDVRQQILGDRIQIAPHQHDVTAAHLQPGRVRDRKLPQRRRAPDRLLRGGRDRAQLGAQAPGHAHAELLVPDVVDDLGALHGQGQRIASLARRILQGHPDQDAGRKARCQVLPLGRTEQVLHADADQQLAALDRDARRALGQRVVCARRRRRQRRAHRDQHRDQRGLGTGHGRAIRTTCG
jgi:hypothetical protein